MDINTSINIMVRTHVAAVSHNVRASSIEQVSGPGIGKSDSKRDYCMKLARELDEPVGYVRMVLGTVSSVDLRGFMLPVKDSATGHLGTQFSTPPWYPTQGNMRVYTPDGTEHQRGTWTRETPRVGVLDLDEFGQAEDDVKKAAADLLLYGGVGDRELPALWRVVAASNRMSDRSGVARNLMFLVNRRCQHDIEALVPPWLEWAARQPDATRPHYLTISFAQKNPDLVFRSAVPAGTDPFCTPRTLCLMDYDLRALRSPEDEARDRLPLDAAAREVCAGWIGQGEAAQFYTHLKYADELPEISEIEANPKRAKLPAARDAQMVAGYMLAHHVTTKNASQIMEYLCRLNVEMQVLSVRAITAQAEAHPVRAAAIINTTEMTNWFAKHKDLLMASRA